MKYEIVEKMLRQDFEVAKVNHDFSEMADDYELLRELWATGELDSEEYRSDEIIPMVHVFAEVRNNQIMLPSEMKFCVKNLGKKVIYTLEKYSIKLIMEDVDDKIIYDYYLGEGIETKYIILSKSITINKMAREVLDLHNGDVIELCIDEEMISISKINWNVIRN